MFRELISRIGEYFSGEQGQKPKPKVGIEERAAARVQALTGRWEMVEAQVKLAATSRRELRKLVAQAKALEAIGKQAMASGNTQKAEAAAAQLSILQTSIESMKMQAMSSDEQATQALSGFKIEAKASRRAVEEAKALAQLENVLDLQKKQQQLELTYSTAADEYEEAKDNLLLEASVQAATASLQVGEDSLDNEVKAHMKDQQVRQITAGWQKQLKDAGGQVDAEFEVINDATDQAIDFLDRPAFGGMLGFGEPMIRDKKPTQTKQDASGSDAKSAEAGESSNDNQ